ncbi:MAG: thiolase [Marinosulfonomonas sp.]|nr:thiolase [Marinosulfonomonas sp.]
MSNGRDPVIVGVADSALADGKFVKNASVLGHMALVAKAALEEAGLSLSDVDGLLTAGMWGVPGPGQLPTVSLGEYLGIMPIFVDGTNIGGSAFEAHVAHAAMALEKGYCEVALIVYGSDQRSLRSRNLGGRPSVLGMQHETPYGMPTPVGGYAMAAKRHMHEYGTTSEHLAEIAVATRKWAQLNPAATRRDDLSIDDVMNSGMISEPLHLLDCCLVTDGAGAIVMTTAERAKDLKSKPISVKGYGEAHTHWTVSEMPDLAHLLPAKQAGKTAMEMAGVSHSDIDVVQIYDSFTITVLLSLEALGFCKPGEGGPFVSNQNTAPGGAFPMNTSGGGLSALHPGMFGIFLLIEAARQLRGECGERQVSGAKTALVHGTGGTLSSGATVILQKD